MDMVEDVFSIDVLEDIIEKIELPNNGAYIATGTYNHEEIFRMTLNLSQVVDILVVTLLEVFGQHLFNRFSERYPTFFKGVSKPFEFLKD
jgi:hypothetical protein